MNDTNRQNTEETGIKSLLDQYLASRKSLKSSIGETSLHLDEDSLATFAEGTMTQRESAPVISHLVDCGFCRHKTAELVMLDLELSGEDTNPIVAAATTEPSSISSVLNNLLSKIFGTTDQAVLAHREDEADTADAEDEKDSKPE